MMRLADMDRKLLTLSEGAEICAVTYARMAEMARTGLVPAVKLGRQVRLDPEKLALFIDQGGKPLPGGWRKEPR
jgi:hypothetical protein